MDLPQVQALFERAEAALPGIHPPAVDVMDWLRKHLEDDRIMLLVAFEPGLEPKGYALLTFWTDLWNTRPWASSVHADNTMARVALRDAMHKELLDRGHTKLVAINQTGASDRAYAWLWRKKANVRVVGPMVEFDLLTEPPAGGKEEA
jgi:hypothetical protein